MEFVYKNSSLISQENINRSVHSLAALMKGLRVHTETIDYSKPESFISLPFDKRIKSQVEAVRDRKVGTSLKYIFVIGIGGANLGAKAVYDALFGYLDAYSEARYPKMFFIDTVNPRTLESLSTFFKERISFPDEILVCIVSKSGETIETIGNLQVVTSLLEKKFDDITDRLVVVTREGSQLWRIAESKGVQSIAIPEGVGDRYSIFSPVGLVPLSFLQIDLNELLLGAREELASALSENPEENRSLSSAAILFEHYKEGRRTNDNFFFHPELESLGKWYRQLMAESLGEEKNVRGRTERIGITPTVSIGSVDLHSMAQLYLAGPQNQVTTFVFSEDTGADQEIANAKAFIGLAPDISGEHTSRIVSAIYRSIKTSYLSQGIPFMEVVMPDLSLRSLGRFMQFKMMEILYLGALLDVYVFDQPNVEEYKRETRRILGKN